MTANHHSPCLACGRIVPLSRGLCPRDYRVIYLSVRAGKTTWEEEIAAGKALAVLPKRSLVTERR